MRRLTGSPAWRDVRVLRTAAQVVFVAAVAAGVWYLWFNLITNLRTQGIRTDFGYLGASAGFSIAGSGFSSSDTIREALSVGVLNTLLVSATGIVLASIGGLVIGVARLSTNWIVSRLAALYVESLRNVPVLVIIIFWSTAVLLRLPRIDEALTWEPVLVLSNRGVWIPWIGTLPRFAQGSVTGGFRLLPEYLAVLLGLSVYTASHIAEIVRGSIQSVSKGQTEAAQALGLSGFQRLRLVVIPQALRVMVPPLANQYLNLTKNSSLGVAVAYAEITSVTNIVIGNGNPAPQSIAILMVIYLTFSLSISGVTNFANRRLRIASR